MRVRRFLSKTSGDSQVLIVARSKCATGTCFNSLKIRLWQAAHQLNGEVYWQCKQVGQQAQQENL